MKPRSQVIGKIMSIGVALFGAWTLYAHIVIYFRADFTLLQTYSLAPVLLVFFLLLIMTRSRAGSSIATANAVAARVGALDAIPAWFWFLCPFFIVAVLWLSHSEWIFWGLASAYLLAAARVFSPYSVQRQLDDSIIGAWEATILAAICLVAVLLTLGSYRPDPDDAFFVSLASATLDNPTAPLYGFDNLYRSAIPPLEQAFHLLQTYEYFVAVLASTTGLSVHLLYYVVLPALWTVVGGLIHWILLRRFLPWPSALIGLAAVIFFLALWGDEHRTYGNFAFVRMYQGKAIYLFVALPMLVNSVLEFRNEPSARNWLLLMLHQCAGVGFTVNGAVIGPLAVGVALLAGMQWSRQSVRDTVAGVSASLFVLIGAVWMKLYLKSFYAIAKESIQPVAPVISTVIKTEVNNFYNIPSTVVQGYQTALGLERSNLVLLGLLLLPLLASRAKLRELSWICNYTFLCTLLLLCPAVSLLLGTQISHALSWRVFWAWPVPLLLGLMIGALSCLVLVRPWIRLTGIAAIALVFAFAGPASVSRDIWSWQNIGRYKVFPSHDAALFLMERIDHTRPALVPEELAISLVGLRDAPPLIAVRNYYLRNMGAVVPESDLKMRRALLSYIDERWVRQIDKEWVLAEIERQGVATVAYLDSHPDADFLAAELAARGFDVQEAFGHMIAIKRPVEE